jgi:hypothetical protein
MYEVLNMGKSKEMKKWAKKRGIPTIELPCASINDWIKLAHELKELKENRVVCMYNNGSKFMRDIIKMQLKFL